MRVAALLTCHNRRELTLACLEALRRQRAAPSRELDIFVVDDGSADGTAQAVRSRFPDVRILSGGGDLFWNRGMHRAFGAALDARYDAYVWLNDDTVLRPDALDTLESAARAHLGQTGRWPIVVGTTIDPDSGEATYGGHRRVSLFNPLSMRLIGVVPAAAIADTFNGNIVLIPDDVARRVGNLDPAFEHAMGDIDYGFRARRLGIRVLVAPGVAGMCRHNPTRGGPFDPALSVRRRFRLIRDRRYLPWRSWGLLTFRHGGPLWPVIFLWPYARLLAGGAVMAPREPARPDATPRQ